MTFRDAEGVPESVRRIASSNGTREEKARAISELILRAGSYRWAGIYDVGPHEISVIAWTGPAPPTHPRFPTTQGLNGQAVISRRTIVANDVAADPHYLTTLGSTRAEIVAPVLAKNGAVIGTIDVESEIVNRFAEADRRFLEECAAAIAPLFVR